MPIADWTVPFQLTSSIYAGATTLPFNVQTSNGIFLLRDDACKLENFTRLTKEDIPQSDGAILHRRFVSGMEMSLTVQFWETTSSIACGDLLQTMYDDIMGYLYGLLNAGDNEGRISWTPSGVNVRMLDDIRLHSYPAETHGATQPMELSFTLDCALPYAEDLTQSSAALDDVGVVITNTGNRPTFPVWQLTGPGSDNSFSVTDLTTGDYFEYDRNFPLSPVISSTDYIEIDTFRDTAYKNGNGANCKPGINMETSSFFPLGPGSHQIILASGTTGTVLWNNAWA
jgi:hypothetical protein